MTEDVKEVWTEINRLRSWNDQAREMIVENEARISELKYNLHKHNPTKENDNG